MFESNAIQFGMDQMLEASSEQLSLFIQLVLLVCSCRVSSIVLYISLCIFLLPCLQSSVYKGCDSISWNAVDFFQFY